MSRDPDEMKELAEQVAEALGMEPTEVIYLPLDAIVEDPDLPPPTHQGNLKRH